MTYVKCFVLLVCLVLPTSLASAQTKQQPKTRDQRTKKKTISSSLTISNSAVSFDTGCDACKLILQNGLYRTLNIKRAGTFEQDLKTYFMSETFKHDFKNHNWGGDLTVLIPQETGPPIPLGLKANASNEDIDKFQQRIATATSIQLSQTFYDFLLSSIPDVDLAKEYTNCVISTCRFGLKPFVDIGESEVTFTINYTKEFDSDTMPLVKNFGVVNGQILQGAIQVGSRLRNVNTVVVKRITDKDMIFVLDTDKGGVSRRIAGESSGFNADFPVGTIISSMLTWTEFQAITKNNSKNPSGNLWSPRYSKWAPADGRGIDGSGFEKATGFAQVPEMRGRFLRGLDSFDPDRPAIDGNLGDPDQRRERGSYQPDDLKSHQHDYKEYRHPIHVGDGGFADGITSNPDNKPDVPTTGGQPEQKHDRGM
jgi:hypothetical protein